ncbi:MAG TPA: DUF4153 domain-containing protein [Saprospiraceae bacterium]|nr:DUF4153 domain-containing protein [Saprospiraceae bacterium]
MILDKVWLTIKRFPLSFAMAVGVASILFIITRVNSLEEDEYIKYLTSFILGFPLCTAAKLIAEHQTNTPRWRYILGFVSILLLIVWFLTVTTPVSEFKAIQNFMLICVSCLLVSIAWFYNKSENKSFWNFNVELLSQLIIGIVYSVILLLGLFLAIYAVQELFDVKPYKYIWPDLATIILCLFFSLFFLSKIPSRSFSQAEQLVNNKAVFYLTKFILIPLTILYFIILYAYGIKIAILWSLPKGWVGSLCLGFSGIGLLSYLLNFNLEDIQSSTLQTLFKKYFFYALAPVIFLLFLAIGVRLSDYGFSIPRYLVLMAACWLAVICLYYVISKKDELRVIPMTMIVALLVSAIGPWNARQVSLISQSKRFIRFINENDLLDKGKIKTNLNSVNDSIYTEMQQYLIFFSNSGRFTTIEEVLPEQVLNKYVESKGKLSSYELMQELNWKNTTSKDNKFSTQFVFMQDIANLCKDADEIYYLKIEEDYSSKYPKLLYPDLIYLNEKDTIGLKALIQKQSPGINLKEKIENTVLNTELSDNYFQILIMSGFYSENHELSNPEIILIKRRKK